MPSVLGDLVSMFFYSACTSPVKDWFDTSIFEYQSLLFWWSRSCYTHPILFSYCCVFNHKSCGSRTLGVVALNILLCSWYFKLFLTYLDLIFSCSSLICLYTCNCLIIYRMASLMLCCFKNSEELRISIACEIVHTFSWTKRFTLTDFCAWD